MNTEIFPVDSVWVYDSTGGWYTFIVTSSSGNHRLALVFCADTRYLADLGERFTFLSNSYFCESCTRLA